ncbi:MAG: multiheme c-type cytochrome [Alphaproteobacteria bacterium]
MVAGALTISAAQAQELPNFAEDAHVGVASCAGSTCHGAVQPAAKATVLQTEYITWQRQDKHANAYKVLLNDRSKRIARNLGLEAAHTAKMCLDCHADNPTAQRGTQFQISDGVGCEACHGGAVRWLGIHVSGLADHAQNVENGLYPTEDPVARAKLCLSCHFGEQRKWLTHRIMGAGHPRVSFELDTFTAIQPAHYEVDEDYVKRKQVASGVQTWAIGQAIQVSELMEAMADPKMGRDGIFPELVLFDCHACHHPMSNLRWEPRASTGLQPGIPRINDSNLLMLRIIADAVAPDQGKKLREQTLALHQASVTGPEATVSAAKAVKATADALAGTFAGRSFSGDDVKKLLDGVVQNGLSGEYVDYAAAEQATMAVGSLLATWRKIGGLGEAQFNELNASLDAAFKAVENDESYRPAAYRSALQNFKAAVDKI